jgi:hypothetical protein
LRVIRIFSRESTSKNVRAAATTINGPCTPCVRIAAATAARHRQENIIHDASGEDIYESIYGNFGADLAMFSACIGWIRMRTMFPHCSMTIITQHRDFTCQQAYSGTIFSFICPIRSLPQSLYSPRLLSVIVPVSCSTIHPPPLLPSERLMLFESHDPLLQTSPV